MSNITSPYRRLMGMRLRSLREKLGETQSQFAQRLGIIKLSLLKYEAGVTCPTAEQLHSLESSGVDATYVAFGHPSLVSPIERRNFAAAFSWVKRESQISSLDVSDEDLIDAAWFMFCKLSHSVPSDGDVMVNEARLALDSLDPTLHGER